MMNRRKFLYKMGYVGGGGLLASLLAETVLFDQLVQSRAWAAGADIDTNYLNINMGGGPPRYMADHWLKVSPLSPSPIVSSYSSTNFVADGAAKVVGQEYRTFSVGEYEAPHLYSTLPKANGIPLLSNTLIVQGYGTGVDGHGLNSNLQFHPLASAASFSGLVADLSRRPFQAARHPDTRSGKFVSLENVSINPLNRANPLNTLLGALVADNPTRSAANDSAIKAHFDAARRQLVALGSSHAEIRIGKESLKRGYDLLNSSLGAFDQEWAALVQKYRAIVEGAMRDAFVPGITATLDGKKQISFAVDDSDIRFDTGTSAGYLENGSNLMQLCDASSNDSIVVGLALAEFVFKNKLVSALEIHGGTIDRLLLAPGLSNNRFFEIGNDMHGAGGYVANMAMLTYHRGILAGIGELRSSLIAAGTWSSTHVHLTSEFDRKISAKGGGSGHGTEQMVSSLISGKIEGGPYVVGNVFNTDNKNGDDSVSQGLAAPIANYSNQRPTPLTMCSTMAAVIYPDFNPWKNVAPPLVTRATDGRLSLPYGKGKVI